MRCVDFVSVFDICTFKSFCRDFKTRTSTALINACLNSIEIHFLFGSRNITDISQSGRLTISLNFRNLCCTLLHFVFLLANKTSLSPVIFLLFPVPISNWRWKSEVLPFTAKLASTFPATKRNPSQIPAFMAEL